jgi:hypothetical protein
MGNSRRRPLLPDKMMYRSLIEMRDGTRCESEVEDEPQRRVDPP